jgi:hypothetical protein
MREKRDTMRRTSQKESLPSSHIGFLREPRLDIACCTAKRPGQEATVSIPTKKDGVYSVCPSRLVLPLSQFIYASNTRNFHKLHRHYDLFFVAI